MDDLAATDRRALARQTGRAWLATIAIGVAAAVLIGGDIDINLSADTEAVARAMLDAETRLRAMAWAALLVFALELLVSLGLYHLLRSFGPLLAAWSLAARLMGSLLSVLGAVYLMNAAEIADHPIALADLADRLLLNSLQATSNYTSFHLSLVLSSSALAGFFWLFFRSALIPGPIAGWGLFASVFVAATIVLRDFVPLLSNGAITLAFMASNLIALLFTSIYLAVRGVRS